MAKTLKAQAGALNIVIEQGTTFNPVLTYTDDLAANIDLTGYTARMQIRAKKTDVSFLNELTTENGGLTLGGAAGTISLLLSAADTAAIAYKKGVYDLEIISAGGIVNRLLEGTIAISAETTK